MKIIKKKERGYHSFSEKYDLSGAYAGKQGVSIGVLLLYIIVNRSGIESIEITAEARGDIGEERNILHIDAKEYDKLLKDVNELAELFVQKELNIWELQGVYSGTSIAITGRAFGTILSVRTPLTSKVNLIPLMSNIETLTYEYHDYDPRLVDLIKLKFKLNQKLTIQTIVDFESYPDLWNEFVNGMSSMPFAFPKENALTAEGYSAEMLFENYPLSELGAYNYMIYLRNAPKNAIADLEKGLPRK